MDDEKQLREWRKKAYACPKLGKKKHEWIPISNIRTKSSEHVTMLMCGACFLQIHVADTHKYGENVFEESIYPISDSELSEPSMGFEGNHNIF